jgi:hypothetical protein
MEAAFFSLNKIANNSIMLKSGKNKKVLVFQHSTFLLLQHFTEATYQL